MESHREPAERAERALDEMEERNESLGERIEDAKGDWERKQADGSVPGAQGDPQAAEEESPAEGAKP